MMNRTLYQARMAVTPAVIAERSYVPNVITEQIPVTRQVAVPGVRQVTYQIPHTVAVTTTRKVAMQSVRMVADRIQEKVHVTTMRMVPYGATGMAYGLTPGTRSAAVPDPLRTAERIDTSPVVPTPARPIEKLTRPHADDMPTSTTPPVNSAPKSGQVIPPRDVSSDEIVEEVAAMEAPVRRTAGYRPVASPVQSVTSAPSIVRVAQMARRPSFANQEASDVSVASSKTSKK
jgi:hypothetical protein